MSAARWERNASYRVIFLMENPLLKTDLESAVSSLLSAAVAVDTSNWEQAEQHIFSAKAACSRVLSELRTVIAPGAGHASAR